MSALADIKDKRIINQSNLEVHIIEYPHCYVQVVVTAAGKVNQLLIPIGEMNEMD